MTDQNSITPGDAPFESTAAVDALPRRRGTWFPGPRYWIIWALCVLAIAFVRNLEVDLAGINIATMVLTGIAVGLLLFWWVFQSAFPAAIRWLPPTILIVAASVFLVRYRPYKTSGGLSLQFVPRGELVGDQLLDATPGTDSGITVDLATTTANDFPRFLGPDMNSVVKTIRIIPDWDQNPPKELWRSEIGAGWCAFSCVNGFAVTMEQRGDSELVTCRDVETGKLCWTHAIETRHETVLGFVGPRATPTIFNGRVYAMGATGFLRCLNGADGTEIWVRDLFGEYGISPDDGGGVIWGRATSPLIVDDKLFIPVGGNGSGQRTTLLAMNVDTGETIWEAGKHVSSYASPMLMTLHGERQIVSMNEDILTGHDLETGKELWDHPWPGKSNANANVSQPNAVGNDRILISKGYGGGGQLLQIEKSGDEWFADVVWESKRILKTKFSNVAIRDGLAFALDQGVLCCADVETGDRLWRRGKYAYGQVLLVDDIIVVMAESGELVLVRATADGHEELCKFQAIEGQTWNNVCLYGNRILVRNSEEAACFEIRTEAVNSAPTSLGEAAIEEAATNEADEAEADEAAANEAEADKAATE